MRHFMTALILTAAALAVAWFYNNSHAQPATDTPLTKIAVVNIANVLTKCQENIDLEQTLRAEGEQVQAQLQLLDRETDAIKQELENALAPGTEPYLKRLQEWFEKMALREAKEKGQKQVLQSKSQAALEGLYQKLLDEVASLAKQQQISLILDKNEMPAQTRNLSDFYSLIRDRKVLYSSPELDLTDQVLENLNRTYQAKKAAK